MKAIEMFGPMGISHVGGNSMLIIEPGDCYSKPKSKHQKKYDLLLTKLKKRIAKRNIALQAFFWIDLIAASIALVYWLAPYMDTLGACGTGYFLSQVFILAGMILSDLFPISHWDVRIKRRGRILD